jgi:hypothetical protein
LLDAGELQHDKTLRLPVTLQCLELPTPDDKAAAVLCDRGRDLLAIFLQTGRVVDVDINDDIG